MCCGIKIKTHDRKEVYASGSNKKRGWQGGRKGIMRDDAAAG